MMMKRPRSKYKIPDRVTKAALRATFEILFRKKHPDVKYFIFFCNLVNILHDGPAAAATKIKVHVRGFLQLRTPTALTAIEKLLLCLPQAPRV
jgi:hypothetical protein